MTDIEQQLFDFIKKNSLNLEESGSGLNSTLTIICGYALYIDINRAKIDNVIISIHPDFDDFDELNRVYDYCKKNMYGNWWEKEENRKMYIL